MEPWTVAFAQVALAIAVRSVRSAGELLERVHAGLPAPPDLADRQEGRRPYNQATGILATIGVRSQRRSPPGQRSASSGVLSECPRQNLRYPTLGS